MNREFVYTYGKKNVYMYHLENDNGMRVSISNYGAIVTSILVPDRQGLEEEITLGYDTIQDYTKDQCFFGATVGRYANRIANSQFELNGITYRLPSNEGVNHLHGGVKGFNRVVWDEESAETDIGSVRLSYVSSDGEQGYPGTLRVCVQFSIDNDNMLKIQYWAETDQDTVINLTNHTYFNLAGHNGGDIGSHYVKIYADQFTPVNKNLIPTGVIEEVKNTALDFQEFHTIGERIDTEDEQIKIGGGYDHNYVINGEGFRNAAEVYDKKSGRLMKVYTNKPCIQFYSGNFLSSVKGRRGVMYHKRNGFCMETQFAPDSPNQKNFPSAVLRPGETYDYTTCYHFSIIDS